MKQLAAIESHYNAVLPDALQALGREQKLVVPVSLHKRHAEPP
jgi:hypothetical protein